MNTVTLELRDGGAVREPIDLDRLTPRARALAEVIASTPLQTRPAVILESTRTIREMGGTDDDAIWYGADAMDAPHRVIWEHWARYPQTSPVDPHDYLEGEARKLPLGYYPVGRAKDQRVPSADAARDDTDLITRAQIAEVLRELGRPISLATLANYKSRPPAGWPQPVKYIGRTPLWSRSAIEQYARTGTP